MRFAYQNNGRPLLSWKGGTAPQGTRAADAKALGSLGGSSIDGPTLELPRAGAPEPVGPAHPLSGCTGCGLGSFADRVTALPLPAKIAGAAALFLLYKHMKKRR